MSSSTPVADRWLNADVSICDIMRNAACKRARRERYDGGTTARTSTRVAVAAAVAEAAAAWKGKGERGREEEGEECGMRES